MMLTQSRAPHWAALLLLSACGGSGDAGACDYAWGNLLTPAKSNTFVTDYTGPGVTMIAWQAGGPHSPMLLVDAERVGTASGKKTTCRTDQGSYYCGAEGSFGKIVVTLGQLKWSVANECKYYEDARDIRLDAPDCIKEGTIVVEGDLLDYDPTKPTPALMLTGPRQRLEESLGALGEEDHAYRVATSCTVKDGHYECPTLGYLNGATHSLVAGGIETDVLLPVANCMAERVQLDFQCPAIPVGFSVRGLMGGRHKVTASYEGGEPFACKQISDCDTQDVECKYLCPPAIEDERGRGTYHVVAAYEGGSTTHEGDTRDVFDGCRGGRELVLMERR